MRKRYITVAAGVLWLCIQTAYAAGINMIVCQADPESVAEPSVRKVSQQIEQSVIDSLFDAGHIVTNETIVTAGNRESAVSSGYRTARDSYMDFYVVIVARYRSESSGTAVSAGLETLESVMLEIRNVVTDQAVCQETLVPTIREKEKKDQAVIRFGTEIADKICKEIRASK